MPRRKAQSKSTRNQVKSPKYAVESDVTDSNLAKPISFAQQNSTSKSQSLTSKQVLRWAMLPVLFCIWLYFSPETRWNLVLLAYMPTMSGLYLDLEWLLEPIRRSYIDTEMSMFPELFEGTPILEISAKEYQSWDNFVKLTNNLRSPAVVRGLFKDSKAVETFGTDAWLAHFNDFKVKSIKSQANPDKYGYELQDEEFSDFVADIKAGQYKYGYGLDGLYSRYPELVGDLDLKRYGRYDGRDYNFCHSMSLFISSSGKGLRWHNANHANFGYMVQGSKDFHLIHPKYSMFMGPDGNEDPYSTGFAARSPIDLINKLPQNTVRINAGDAIYLPPWHWHAVETYASNETGINMLHSCRFGAIMASVSNNHPLELYRHTGFINWLHKKTPVIFRHVPYFRVLQDGVREYFGWMPKWDSDDCYSSKKKSCEAYFKSVGFNY